MNNASLIDLPLKGFRVLDLSRILAGPYCTMILGDQGADVIKVERPGSGDDTRTWGPPFAGGESAYYLCCNRNKKSIVIDLTNPAGLELVRELAKVSDVLVENFTPGLTKRFGLDFESIHKINPRLVYCSITAYGQDGPYRNRPGCGLPASETEIRAKSGWRLPMSLRAFMRRELSRPRYYCGNALAAVNTSISACSMSRSPGLPTLPVTTWSPERKLPAGARRTSQLCLTRYFAQKIGR